jgi:ribulose-phosphate 3-epimerase
MTTIAPSVLSADFLNLESELKRLNEIDNLWIHLDVMDSHFVPNLTFGKPILKNFKNISKHPLDAHLMVTNPDFFIDNFSDLGIHNFTFHWEAATHHDRLIAKAKEIYPSVGISLNPSTPVSAIPKYILEKIDLVLLMSVNPGFSGQKFISDVYNKIEAIQKVKEEINPQLQIQVDGGVDYTNAKKLIDKGATNLVSGSYIFGAENNDYKSRIDLLR